jgi:hypothetical protein
VTARWASFAAGLWLVFAPLVLGYESVPAVLHDVAVGLVVCVGAVAALEWPLARLAQLAPAIWLVGAPAAVGWESPSATANHLATGLLIAALAAVPSARLTRRAARPVSGPTRA